MDQNLIMPHEFVAYLIKTFSSENACWPNDWDCIMKHLVKHNWERYAVTILRALYYSRYITVGQTVWQCPHLLRHFTNWLKALYVSSPSNFTWHQEADQIWDQTFLAIISDY